MLRLYTIGTCAWVQSSSGGLKEKRIKRPLKSVGDVNSKVHKKNDPVIRIAPPELHREQHRAEVAIRNILFKDSVATPWSSGMRFVPRHSLEKIAYAAAVESEKFKDAVELIIASYDDELLKLREESEVLAAAEYKLADPFGFVDQEAWSEEFVNDILKDFPAKEDLRDGSYAHIILGNFSPIKDCPPGFMTIGTAALEYWAGEMVDLKLLPLKDSLVWLRAACSSSNKKESMDGRRLSATSLEGRVEQALLWESDYPTQDLTEALMDLMDYYGRHEGIFMRAGNEDVRKRMGERTLKCLLLLSGAKLKERVDYLLEDI